MPNYLIIVEGKVEEELILRPILEKNNYVVIKEKQLKFNKSKLKVEYGEFTFNKEDNNIVIVQGFQNRLKDLLNLIKKNEMIEEYFDYRANEFAGIFFIYDVDHTPNDILLEFYNKYNDPSTGLLLLSNPCIQVLCDRSSDEIEYIHLKEYKKHLRSLIKEEISLSNYISKNSAELLKYHFLKNNELFPDKTLDEQISFTVQKVSATNVIFADGIQSEKYYYLISCIYYIIAYINKYVYKDNEKELLLKKLEFLSAYKEE